MPKVPKRIPHYILTHEQVEKVMAQPDTTEPFGVRDRAMLEILYSTGVRSGELAGIAVEDIHFSRNTILVRAGKNKRERIIPIGESALQWSESYLQIRPLLLLSQEEETLFVNSCGKPLSPNSINHIVKRHFRSAGIEKKGSTHLLRHTMATLMLENGADIRYIQEMLGHQLLHSTEIYTEVTIRKLKEVHALTHPAKMKPTKSPQILKDL